MPVVETFAVAYGYVPEMAERRGPHRGAHLEFLKALLAQDQLVLAGALTDPIDGAWIVVRAESQAAARALMDPDPYARAGLISSVTIRPISIALP
jgi:uncharacterized protein